MQKCPSLHAWLVQEPPCGRHGRVLEAAEAAEGRLGLGDTAEQRQAGTRGLQ